MTFSYAASERATRKEKYQARFHIPLCSRSEFLAGMRDALEKNAPYAVAGLGMSENHWMYYPIFLEERPGQTKLRVFHMQLIYNALSQVGIFPPQPDFYLRYNEFFMEHVRHIDWLGLVLEPVMEPKIVRHYDLRNKLINHLDLIPDKSIPDNPANCYVPFFKDKKILIVCPFAAFLKQRMTKEIFQGVWSKTGKRWFYPAGVDALEFPYGFDPETAKHYATAIDLFEHIASEVARRDFDVALIAAGGLAVPLASYVKSIGKIAIDLGGELQFLLGVNGKRWRDDARWTRDYGTEWWIDVPDKYRPQQVGVAGAGAFW